MAETTQCYLYNNIQYNITETEDIHELLTDEKYFETYIKNHGNANEIAIPEDKENCNASNFAWTAETTKLLITEYSKRCKAFRDPRKKKINVWREILKIFEDHGYTTNEAILDRKFRNMKYHYKTILDNNNKSKTGRGRISWEYFDAFEEIFADDRTIKSGPIISSLNFQTSSNIPSDTLHHTVSPITLQSRPSCSYQQQVSQPLFISVSDQLSSRSTSPTAISDTCHDITSINTTYALQPSRQELQEKSTKGATPVQQVEGTPQRIAKKRKASEMKTVHNFRRDLLRVEQRRIDAIEKLSEQLVQYNSIQRERNELIKKIYKLE